MIREFTLEIPSGNVEMVEISDEQGNATQMLKSTYDAQQAAQMEHLTEIIPADEA